MLSLTENLGHRWLHRRLLLFVVFFAIALVCVLRVGGAREDAAKLGLEEIDVITVLTRIILETVYRGGTVSIWTK